MTFIEKTSGTFESFDGTRLYYEVRGQGQPLVFVYGIACLMNHWNPQIQYFSQNYQTIMLDFRGHHFSEVPSDKRNLSLEALAKDLHALCDHLKIDKADFIGHSFGCEVALQAYLLNPDRFKSLTFISGFFSNPFAQFASADVLKDVFRYAKKAYNAYPEIITSLWKIGATNPVSVFLSSLVGGFNIQKTAMKDIEIYAQGVANIDVRVFITLFEQLVTHYSLDQLPLVNAKTLIIAGENDSLTPREMQEQMRDLLNNAELFIVPSASHCVQLDFPDVVNEKLDEFLTTT